MDPESKFGEFVRTEHAGQERVYVCGECGKPKLYYNRAKGLYHCFSCGLSGAAGTHAPRSDDSFLWKSERMKYNHQGKIIALIGTDHLNLAPVRARASSVDNARWKRDQWYLSTHSGWIAPALALFEAGNPRPVGHYAYLGRGRYRTYGTRGIHSLPDIAGGDPPYLFITEGMFDMISIGEEFPDMAVICTCGNEVSIEQFHSIRALLNDSRMEPVVAFDSDRPGHAMRLFHELKQATGRSVGLIFPPPPYKDWDEAIQIGGVEPCP